MRETVAVLIKRAIKANGYPDTKSCAEATGLRYGLFRKVVGDGHIPRDQQVLEYADKLGNDKGRLIRLAHYERAPEDAKGYLKDLRLGLPSKRNENNFDDGLTDEVREYLEKATQLLASTSPEVAQVMKSSINAYLLLEQDCSGG